MSSFRCWLFTGALALRKRSLVPSLIVAALLLGLKEDEIFFVVWFGGGVRVVVGPALGNRARRAGRAQRCRVLVDRSATRRCSQRSYLWPGRARRQREVHAGRAAAGTVCFRAAGDRTLAIARSSRCSPRSSSCGRGTTSPAASDRTTPRRCSQRASLAAAFGLRRFPGFARAMIPCALVVTLVIFTDTDLRPGRWPYIVDWNAYARAVRIRDTRRCHDVAARRRRRVGDRGRQSARSSRSGGRIRISLPARLTTPTLAHSSPV